jgi:hypothetical protein
LGLGGYQIFEGVNMLTSKTVRLSLVTETARRGSDCGGIARLASALRTHYLDWRIRGIDRDIEAMECDLIEIPEAIKIYRRTQTELLIKKATLLRP